MHPMAAVASAVVMLFRVTGKSPVAKFCESIVGEPSSEFEVDWVLHETAAVIRHKATKIDAIRFTTPM